jgi:hypothetical protein
VYNLVSTEGQGRLWERLRPRTGGITLIGRTTDTNQAKLSFMKQEDLT